MNQSSIKYTIKIDDCSESKLWYYKRIGSIYDAILVQIKGVKYFRVDCIHKARVQDCSIISIEKINPYTRFK